MLNDQSEYEYFISELGVNVPPRSMLYSLDPIGLGTPLTECLSSYMSRLAEAHCISVKELAKLAVEHSSNRMTSTCNLKRVNGFGAVPEHIVEGLEALTLRNDLSFLTTLPLKGLFQYGVFKDKKAWCSNCFKEWNNNSSILYEPLLWHFNGVNHCYIHRTPLTHRCGNCEMEMEVVVNLGKTGYCIYCNSFLGSGSQKSEEKDIMNLDVLEFMDKIAELIQHAPEVKNLNRKKYIFRGPIKMRSLMSLSSYDEDRSAFNSLRKWTRDIDDTFPEHGE
jgi:hypothetical protein